jgi:acylpyruvate hydrolase
VDLLIHDAFLRPEEVAAEASFGHPAADYAVGLATSQTGPTTRWMSSQPGSAPSRGSPWPPRVRSSTCDRPAFPAAPESRRPRDAKVGAMRLATIRTEYGTSAARLDGDVLIPLDAADVGQLLAAGGEGQPRPGAAPVAAAEADFAPVVPRPGKIICVGLNYRSHILETGRELPEYPTLFGKFADSLLGARDDLVLPSVSDRVDWEVELGVIIGRPLRRATAEQAAAAFAGFTVVNDVSMRDWQRRTLQWLQGKAFEHSSPAGPYLVTPDEVGNGADLEVRCEVDGTLMQRARTSDLLFGPAEIAAYASQVITLQPGDLLVTGTPNGVGDARKPPVYLQPGNTLRTWIEGLGECVNRCVAEQAG